MAFRDTILTFKDDKIIADEEYGSMEVMMSWEAPIMEKSAEYVCQSKGDILELGFGMGICADYIQAQNVNSHTIVEIHPQVIEKLKVWASGKPNVTIVEGDWKSVALSTYDGIFLDTFGDSTDSFKDFIASKAKNGAKITYWNNYANQNNKFLFDTISFEEVDISPRVNMYTDLDSKYYMPKVVI